MDDVGFDGKIHEKPPSTGPIFVALFAISVVYWIACELLLPSYILGQLMFPLPVPNGLLAFALNWLPVAMTLGAVALFRLPEKLDMSGWVFFIAGILFDRLAYLIVPMIL